MIKAFILDDEAHARETVANMIETFFNTITVVAQSATIKSAVETINKHKPDLLFLDIDLPDGTAFDLLKQIDYKRYKIIFITAFSDYAIRAIKFSAFDYILKPVKTKELVQAINNVLEEERSEHYTAKFDAIFANFNSSQTELEKIVLKTAESIFLINIKDIIYCKADNTYTMFHLFPAKRILVSKNIKRYSEMLANCGFMRVHQSYLINLNYISHFHKADGGILVMSNGAEIPVSERKKQQLLNFIATFKQ